MPDNSKDKSLSIPGATINLALAIPPAMFRALATKIIKFFNAYFQNMLKVVLDISANSKNFNKEVDNSKKTAKILLFITTEVLKQPDVQKLFLEMAEELQNVFEQVIAVLKESLQKLKIMIDEEGEIIQRAAYKQTYQTVDKILSAVVAGVSAIPVVGNVITAVVAGAEIITPLQTLTQQSIIVFIKTADKLIDLLNEVAVPGLDAVQSSIKVAKNVLKTSQIIIGKIDAIRHGIESDPAPQKGGKRDVCACVKFSKKDLPKLPSENEIISTIDNTRRKSVKKIKTIGGGSEKLDLSVNKKKQKTANYITAEEVPWPSFAPPKKEAYIEAEKPYAGVGEKWINIVDKMKKEAEKRTKQMNNAKKKFNKEMKKRKKQLNNAKNMVNNAKKTAKELKEAPGKLKKNAQKVINNTKKSINNTKKLVKKSTNKKALKGGRRSRTRARKSRSRKRRTRKNKTY